MTSFAHRKLKKLIKSRHAKVNILKWSNCLLPEKMGTQWLYFLYTGKRLNLENPVTYPEKLQWYKLYYHDPLMTLCTDKIQAKRYVEACGLGRIVTPLLQVWDSADEIDFDALPDKCYLKCNHDSGGLYLWDRSMPQDIPAIRRRFSQLLSYNSYYLGREWPYKDIAPKVFAEEAIVPKRGRLADWRVYCFYGEPKAVIACSGMADERGGHTDNYHVSWFDAEFNTLYFGPSIDCPLEEMHPRPSYFEDMMECARVLSCAFPQVRVDFFGFDDEFRFSELTFFSDGGYLHLKNKWGKRLGEWFPLPEKYGC